MGINTSDQCPFEIWDPFVCIKNVLEFQRVSDIYARMKLDYISIGSVPHGCPLENIL